MKVEQTVWTTESGWKNSSKSSLKGKANLVIAFGQREILADPIRFNELSEQYPNAKIILGSTSGEIFGTQVQEGTVVASVVQFDKTSLNSARVNIKDFPNSQEAGKALINLFPKEGLRHIFVISDGQLVNGTDLINGINAVLPPKASVTGGLAGDGAQFQKTLVGLDATPSEGEIVAIGFYGDALKVGYGSMGGWDAFGPERKITKSEANVLFELDNSPALDLYKNYLGDKAAELPASGLLFPLVVKDPETGSQSVVRTLLAVDEGNQSMTFAGNIPMGGTAQLMKANFDRLVDGASLAAEKTFEEVGTFEPELALLVSCVGRKLVLGQRIEDEVEAVQNIVGKKAKLAGFYSYGELAPNKFGEPCYLHNQTMTVTVLSEK